MIWILQKQIFVCPISFRSHGIEVATGFNSQPLDVLVMTSDELALLASDLLRCSNKKQAATFGSGDPGVCNEWS